MANLWNFTFEDGVALGGGQFPDVIDVSNQSGEGLAGSTWGVRGNSGASDAEKYYGEFFLINFGHTGRAFKFKGTFDHLDSAENPDGYPAFEMFTYATAYIYGITIDTFLSLSHGFGDGHIELALPAEGSGYDAVWSSAAGLIVPNTTQTLEVCGTISTGATGSVVTADGIVSISVGGINLITLTARKIGAIESFGGGTWKGLHVNPMGRFDNFAGYSDGCGASSFSNDSCCGSPGSGSGGGGDGGGSEETPGETGDTPPPDDHIVQPDWTPFCTGGGIYLSAPDPTPTELWS